MPSQKEFPLLRFMDCPTDTRTEAGEVMSGILEVIGSTNFAASCSPNRIRSVPFNRPQRVFVRVYRTSSEHFAVLYPARAIITACRPLASLNLKSCVVKQLKADGEFCVSPKSCEGLSVTFRGVENTNEVQIQEWVRAFSEGCLRKKVSDHRLPLPVLEESEEEECVE